MGNPKNHLGRFGLSKLGLVRTSMVVENEIVM
jgi:hypothetical protein